MCSPEYNLINDTQFMLPYDAYFIATAQRWIAGQIIRIITSSSSSIAPPVYTPLENYLI